MTHLIGECLFLDVGQGTANAIITHDRRLLIIDAGPHRSTVLHQLLLDFEFESIDLVILSHNDQDHIRGWEEIARQHSGKIRSYYLLQDRQFEEGDIFDYTMYLAEAGLLPRPRRAEIRSLAQPETIWKLDDTQRLSVELLFPDMAANVAAQRGGSPNKTSAVAVLSCMGEKVLFPGDTRIDAWEQMGRASPERFPLKLAILVVPHHGGFLGTPQELDDFFTEILLPQAAVVSVGTHNKYGHPDTIMLGALRKAGAEIICTQVTPRCHGGRPVASFGPSVIDNVHLYSISKISPGSLHVGCAGTVVAKLSTDGIEIVRRVEHVQAISQKLSTPQCLVDRRL